MSNAEITVKDLLDGCAIPASEAEEEKEESEHDVTEQDTLNQEVVQEIIEYTKQYFDLSVEELTSDTEIRKAITDSLGLIEYFLEIENTFSILIDDEDIPNIITIADLAQYIEDHSDE